MSNFVIALFFGLGSGAWVYNKIYRKTGGNTKNSLLVAGIAGAIGLVVILLILGAVVKK